MGRHYSKSSRNGRTDIEIYQYLNGRAYLMFIEYFISMFVLRRLYSEHTNSLPKNILWKLDLAKIHKLLGWCKNNDNRFLTYVTM